MENIYIKIYERTFLFDDNGNMVHVNALIKRTKRSNIDTGKIRRTIFQEKLEEQFFILPKICFFSKDNKKLSKKKNVKKFRIIYRYIFIQLQREICII